MSQNKAHLRARFVQTSFLANEKSCGAVLFTTSEKRHYILVKSAKGHHWGLPKGHVEDNETEQETALREVFEETGVKAQLIEGFREQIEYVIDNRIKKQVVYFVAEYHGQQLEHNLYEISDITLATIDQAVMMVSHDAIRQVLLNADKWLTNRNEG